MQAPTGYETFVISSDLVKLIREEEQCGLYTAKKIAMKRALSQEIAHAETIDDLKPALQTMLEGF